MLFALTLLTVISVVGRAAFSAPIPGDFELVELGMAVTIFAFLPYCQIVRGNVIVDLFTTRASPRTRALLDSIGNLLTAIAALLTWRAALGGLENPQLSRDHDGAAGAGVVGLRAGGDLPRLPYGGVRLHRLA